MLLQKFVGLSLAILAGTTMLMVSMAPASALNPQPLPPGVHKSHPVHTKQAIHRRKHAPVKNIKHGPHN